MLLDENAVLIALFKTTKKLHNILIKGLVKIRLIVAMKQYSIMEYCFIHCD